MEPRKTTRTNSCSVRGCTNCNRPLFHFPNPRNDLHRFRQWVHAAHNYRYVDLTEYQIFRRGFVCYKHFRLEDFIGPSKLLPTAVPTLNLHPDVQGPIPELPPSVDEVSGPELVTEYATDVVDDPSDHQLVEESELLKNLNLYDAKFFDIPQNFDLHVALFRDEQPIKARSTEPDQSIVSPALEKDIFLENCNHENQYESEVIPNPDGENLEKQSITENQSDGFGTPVSQSYHRSATVIETLVIQEMPTQVEKPYFKSVKSFLQDCNRMTEVCRICFQSLEEDEVIKLYDQSSQQDPVQIKKLLRLVLPDLDLEIYPNTVICVKCAELLVYSYQLKEKWLSTEEKLKKLIEKKKGVINRDADLVIIGKRIGEKKVTTESPKDHSYAGNSPHEKVPEQELTDALLGRLALESEEKCLPQKMTIFHGNLNSNNLVSDKQFKGGIVRRAKRKKMPDLRSYICEQCGLMFTDRKGFVKHLKIHNNSRKTKIVNRERTIMCEICGQLFKTMQGLKKHAHSKYKCTFCDRVFETNGKLHHHITSKHLRNTYQCHVCGNQYSYRTSLHMHLKKHNPAGKTKACHLCDKKFIYAQKLKKHLLSHIKERLLKCDYCGKFLKHRWSLETHIKIYHLYEAKYVCEFCNKPYWKRCDLEKHRLRLHQSLRVEQEPGEVFNEENCAVNSIQPISTLEL